jgi:hypothetical protein
MARKEKLLTKIDKESSLEAEGGLFYDPFLECLTKKSPEASFVGFRV